MKKVFIYSYCCPTRRVDEIIIKKFFKENSWIISKNFKEADLIIFITCAATKYMEDKAIYNIIKFQENKKPESKLVIGGCLPSINKKRLKKIFKGFTFGPQSLHRLNGLIDTKKKISCFDSFTCSFKIAEYKLINYLNLLLFLAQLSFKGFKIYYRSLYGNTIPIRTNIGCSNNCSYCAAKFAIGKVKSKSIEKILDEFKYGLKLGYKNFSLLSSDLGSYGKDRKTNFVSLLEKILKIRGYYTINLGYFNPTHFKSMFPKLKKLLKSKKILMVFIPLQSGSNRILRLMNRNYTSQEFKKYIKKLKKINPSIKIRSEVIVGFPGETERDFYETVKLLKELDLDAVIIFRYSNRTNTTSFYMPNQIPDSIIKRRVIKLHLIIFFNKLLKNFLPFL